MTLDMSYALLASQLDPVHQNLQLAKQSDRQTYQTQFLPHVKSEHMGGFLAVHHSHWDIKQCDFLARYACLQHMACKQ